MAQTIDKFGRSSTRQQQSTLIRGPPGEGFKRTSDGDYDMQDRLLKNIKVPPLDNNDATAKQYVDEQIASINLRVNQRFDREITSLKSEFVKYVSARITEEREYYNKQHIQSTSVVSQSASENQTIETMRNIAENRNSQYSHNQ